MMDESCPIQRIGIVGSGNVASHLAKALYAAGFSLVKVYNRTAERAAALAEQVGAEPCVSLGGFGDLDLVLICVSDGAIAEVTKGLPADSKAILCHTSGSISGEALGGFGRYGVFYPLQTFSTGRAVDMGQVPFCLTASDEDTREALRCVASRLSADVRFINDDERRKIHLAAVVVNNFVNHLLYQAEAFLDSEGIAPDILYPLLTETVKKALEGDTYTGQTGPARRGDHKTIATHLDMLDEHKALQKIYKKISKSIIKSYKS